jgi:hypothetical protein
MIWLTSYFIRTYGTKHHKQVKLKLLTTNYRPKYPSNNTLTITLPRRQLSDLGNPPKVTV